jgi:hypothetical protein
MRDKPAAAHEHRWTPVAHLDYCHCYEWRYGCDCGAVRISWAERDLEADPYSAIWLDNDDKAEPCDRCAELLNGATPKSGDEIVEADRA